MHKLCSKTHKSYLGKTKITHRAKILSNIWLVYSASSAAVDRQLKAVKERTNNPLQKITSLHCLTGQVAIHSAAAAVAAEAAGLGL